MFLCELTKPIPVNYVEGRNHTSTASPVMYLNESLCRISRVWPDDQTRVLAALHDSLFQLVTPDVFTGVKDVVAVTDH